MPIVLASTSPYRRALLERVGLEFEAVAPEVDEDAYKGRALAPRQLAEALADAKAAAVAAVRPDAIVIGSDQVCALESEVLSKPGTSERAVDQLQRLAGRTHELITAVAVHRPSRAGGRERERHTDIAHLTMRRLDRAALARYVAADRPTDCAGAYKLEERGISLFERVECEDHSAITGLPMIAVVRILTSFGVQLP